MAIGEGNRAALASIDHELGRIETEKAALDAKKAALETQKAALDDEAWTLKIRRANILNSSALTYSIPNEVLSAIFKAGHFENPDEYDTPFELLVSQVSCRWREISLNTPSLWTRIRRRPFQRRLTAVEEYLRRSKAVHFELVIRVGVPCDDTGADEEDEWRIWPYEKPDFDDVSQFCALITPSMDRCKSVDLTFSIEPEYEEKAVDRQGDIALKIILQHFGSLAVPFLRSINVDWGNGVSFRRSPSQRIFAGGAPLLRSIGVKRQMAIHLCLPPLSSVQSIHLHLPKGPHGTGRSCEELCAMLSAVTSLQHLMVEGDIVETWTPSANVSLPSLRTLSIGIKERGHYSYDAPDEPQFSGLLNIITAPSLELLLMQWVDEYTFRKIPPPIAKFPRLQWLILERTSMPSEVVDTLSKAFDSVRHVVYNTYDPHPLLDANTIWPELRTISILPAGRNFDIIEALSRKCAASANPLEKIFLRDVPPVSAEPRSSILVEKFDWATAYARLPYDFRLWSEWKLTMTANMLRVKLSSIPRLTFYKDELTVARRSARVPQLTCVGEPCSLYTPDVVRCENIGGSGVEVEWKCEADLPQALRFGRVEVGCEGWSGRGDEYVLKGSCGLEYRLVRVPDSLRDDAQASPRTPFKADRRTAPRVDTEAVGFWLFFAAIALWIIYKFFTRPSNPNRAQTPGQPAPRPGPGGAGGWFPGGHQDDDPNYNAFGGAPPPYSKSAPGTADDSNASTWRPGFWTGAALAGAGAALLNRSRDSSNRQARQSYDWEQTREWPRERVARPVQPVYEDRGEGSSNLGSMRTSTGIGGSSVR
ncbi:hypothetical protein HWV62_23575 [Athelia sp. TMB]|nr:hypothetical protein HWV62_23575 [Athelia sp. TMB]